MKPTTEPESHFLDDRSDLVSLVGGQNEKELLERILEARLYNFFATKVSWHRHAPSQISVIDAFNYISERIQLAQYHLLLRGKNQSSSTSRRHPADCGIGGASYANSCGPQFE